MDATENAGAVYSSVNNLSPLSKAWKRGGNIGTNGFIRGVENFFRESDNRIEIFRTFAKNYQDK
jgi:hypothetical protein